MKIVELRKQRNEAVINALDGQVYIKKNGLVEFVDINDMMLKVQGVEMSFNDYFSGIAQYKFDTTAAINMLKQTIEELIEESKKERSYIIVEDDSLGYITNIQLMTQMEMLPQDLLDGYYKLEEGKIILDEARKQELFDLE